MSNIRDYLKEREKRQQTEKTTGYREKIRGHKLAIFYRAALGVILVAAVLFFFIFQWKNKVFTESVITGSTPVTIVQGASVRALGTRVLLYRRTVSVRWMKKEMCSGTRPLKCRIPCPQSVEM